MFGQVGLEDVQLKTMPFNVVPDGFWLLGHRLGAFPTVGMGATHGSNVQMAKGQRMAQHVQQSPF